MANRTKDLTLLVFIILTIVGFAFVFSSNMKANENKKLFEKEMAFRLDIEEKIANLRNENMDLTSALKNKDLDIQQKDKLIDDLNKAVSDQKTEITNLQSELEKAILLKEQSESDLRKTLSSEQR